MREPNAKTYAALAREFGPRGYVQFVRQFRPGRGDWTAERHVAVADEPLERILERLREARSAAPSK